MKRITLNGSVMEYKHTGNVLVEIIFLIGIDGLAKNVCITYA